MNQHYPWAKGLQIPNDVIAVWEMQAAGSDLLRWALANGKILEHIYLDWAKNYYKLPSLSQSFFEKSPNPTLWEKWGRFDWSGTFLPIYEYDGVLYIACLEPPNPFQQQVLAGLNTRTGLLLAPISGMKKWWTIISPVLQMYKQVSGLPPELAQFAEVGKSTPVQNPPMNTNPNSYTGQNPNGMNGYQSQNPSNPYFAPNHQGMNPQQNNNTYPNNAMPGMQNPNAAYPQNGFAEQSNPNPFVQQNQQPAMAPNGMPTQGQMPQQNFNHQAYQQQPQGNSYSNPQQVPGQANFENTNYNYNPLEQANAYQAPANAVHPQVPESQNHQVTPAAQAQSAQENVSVEPQSNEDPPVLDKSVQESVKVSPSISVPPNPEKQNEAFSIMPDLPPVENTVIDEMPPTPEQAPIVNKEIPKPVEATGHGSELEEEDSFTEDFDDITQVRSLDDALDTLEAKHNELLHIDEKIKSQQVSETATKIDDPVSVDLDNSLKEDLENTVLEPVESLQSKEAPEEEITENTVEINFEDFKLENEEEEPEEDSSFELDIDVEDTGIVGLDLSDLNLSEEGEALLQDESPSEEVDDSQEDSIEGLDFSQFEFGKDSADSVRPPSAHLLDSEDELSLENSGLDLEQEDSGAALKIEHPEEPTKITEAPLKQNSFEGDLEKEAAHKCLERIAGICSRRMILEMHQGMLKPYLWEGDWAENPNVKKDIELAESSIFKIVCDTRMPYHGYVVRNDVNDLFLDAFNKGKLPDHATLIPVTLNKNVVAVILGFCEKERVDEIDLHLWERYADEYADAILEINRNHMAA